MVSKKLKIISFLSLVFASVAFIGNVKANNETEVVEAADATDADSYYSSLYDSSGNIKYKGAELRSALNTIVSTGHVNGTYANLGDIFKKSDVNPSNSNEVVLFYTGEKREWNFSSYAAYEIDREHVWCRSHFGTSSSNTGDEQTTPESDAHQIRPCDATLNRSRSNYYYEELTNYTYSDDYGNVWNSGLFYPSEAYRGDVARICFYVATRYSNLGFVDGYSSGATGTNYYMGNISALMKWNLLYDVADTEIQRNNEVAKIQGNRNPFIDHPEYAAYIWEDFNSNTKNIVSQYTYSITFNTNGGSSIDNQSVLRNARVVKPINPTKSGYIFAGWYTDSLLTTAYDFDSKITGNKTLYAKWTSTSGGNGGSIGSSTSTPEGVIDFSAQGFTNGEEIAQVIDSSRKVTANIEKENGNETPKYYTSDNSLKVYSKNTITITSEECIQSVEFTFGDNDGTNEITCNTGTFTSPIWTTSNGSTNQVTFTIGGTTGGRTIKSMKVTYHTGSTDGDNSGETDDSEDEIISSEPSHVQTTIEYLANNKPTENSGKLIYEVSGKWTLSTTSSTATTYGNGSISDDSGNSIKIYGLSSSKETSVTWNESTKTYTYENQRDFSSLGINNGDTISVGLIYASSYDNYYSFFICKGELPKHVDNEFENQTIETQLGFSFRCEKEEINNPATSKEVYMDFSTQGYTNGQEISSFNKDDVTVSFSIGTGTNSPKYYNTGTAIRVYSGGKLTVSAKSKITSIVFGYGDGDSTNTISVNIGSFKTNTWTGSSDSVTFSIGGNKGHRRIKTITVMLEGEESVTTQESWSFNNFYLRFKTTVSKEVFEAQDENATYGVLLNLSSNAPTSFNSVSVSEFNSLYTTANKYLNIEIDSTQIKEENGSYVLTGALTKIPDTQLGTNITAVFYVKNGDTVTFSQTTTKSVGSMVNSYLENTSSLTETQIEALNALKQTYSL